jgi:hypothetical protein
MSVGPARMGEGMRVPAHVCPRCGYRMDGASAVSPEGERLHVAPQPGDCSVCICCGAILEFARYGDPRWLTMEELAALPEELRNQLVRVAMIVLCLRPPRVRFTNPPQQGPYVVP